MLNRKFASIRANVKIDKRNSAAQNTNQRMSQSQSMDMQSKYHQRNHSVNNNILMNLTKEAANRSISSHERRTLESYDASPLATPIRSPIMKSSTQHPYVNLMHQPNYNIPPYQLQYQNNAPLSNQSTPDPANQSWGNSQPIPLVTHYTAAQIYMRPKVNVVNSSYNYQNSSAYSSINKKPPPPEVPKRLSSSISTGSTSSLKKSNGLSRSSKRFAILFDWLID